MPGGRHLQFLLSETFHQCGQREGVEVVVGGVLHRLHVHLTDGQKIEQAQSSKTAKNRIRVERCRASKGCGYVTSRRKKDDRKEQRRKKND